MNNKNGLYLLLGVLLAIILSMTYYIYLEQTKPAGIELKLNENGLSVQQN